MSLSPRQPTNKRANQGLQRRGLQHLAGNSIAGSPCKPVAARLKRHPRSASAAQIEAAQLARVLICAVLDAGLARRVRPRLGCAPSLLWGDDSDSHVPICVAGFLQKLPKSR